MGSLADFKASNPSYAEIPDEQLADALYKKYYAGKIDRADFNAKMQIKPAAPQGPSPREQNAQLIEDMWQGNSGMRGIKGLAAPFVAAFQYGANVGDRAFGEMNEYLGTNIPTGGGEMINEWVRDNKESTSRGQKALAQSAEGDYAYNPRGEGEFDAQGLLGSMVSGGALAKGLGMIGGGAVVGGLTPTTGDDFFTEKATQTVGGAAGGALFKGLGAVGRAIYNRYRTVFEGAKTTVGKAIVDAVGPEKAKQIIAALEADINPLTKGSAGEVATPARSTKFSAISAAADELMPDEAFARTEAQNAAGVGVLQKIAGLKKPGETLRDTIALPMKDKALQAANTHGRRASDPGRLTFEPISKGIAKAQQSVAVQGNPELEVIMNGVHNFLKRKAGQDGIIDAEVLYEFRKTGLTKLINDAVNQGGARGHGEMEALAGSVRPLIDDAIEEASGGLWKAYLRAYSQLSKQVNRGTIGEILLSKFKGALADDDVSPGKLAAALKDGKKTVKEAGVLGGKDVKSVLGTKLSEGLKSLTDDLSRSKLNNRMAAKGSLYKGAGAATKDLTIANPLMREIMVTNAVLRALSKGQQKKAELALGELFQRDPQSGFRALAEAMKNADPSHHPALMRIGQAWQMAEKAAPVTSGTLAGQLGQQ